MHVNTVWCRAIADALWGLGVTDAVVCPGARSAAMVSALAEGGRFRLFVQTDERSAAFFALGMARSLGRPVAICVTSGSAVANVVPALCEAYALGLPLLLLSCDRPRAARGLGLPQTTPQLEFCEPVVVSSLDLETPTVEAAAVADCKEAVARLAQHLDVGPDQGPVQINIPLEGKTSSVDGVHGWNGGAVDERPSPPKARSARHGRNERALAALRAWGLGARVNGLIVAGPDSHGVEVEQIGALVKATGYPLLCDAPGALRGAGFEGAIAEADFIVSRPEVLKTKPDIVVRLGSAPVSASLQRYLSDNAERVVRINARPVPGDFLAEHFVQVVAPSPDDFEALVRELPPGRADWKQCWETAARVCRSRLTRIMPDFPWSEISAVQAALAAPGFDVLHLANSLTLRLANLLLPTSGDGRRVYLNRGVSGIDGTIGAFLGELAGEQRPGLLLIGDLAAIHDISALEACLHAPFPGAMVIINNQGAGLFDTLPVRTVPDYERLIRNPAAIKFEHVARAFGLDYCRCEDVASLKAALASAASATQLRVIEARVPERAAPRLLLRLMTELVAAEPA